MAKKPTASPKPEKGKGANQGKAKPTKASCTIQNRTNQKQVLELDDTQVVLKSYEKLEVTTSKENAEKVFAHLISRNIINILK